MVASTTVSRMGAGEARRARLTFFFYNNSLTGNDEGWGLGKLPQFLLRIWAELSKTFISFHCNTLHAEN